MRNKKSKVPLVLMEQVIMIVVFALASTVCVNIFVKAELVSKRMCATDRAVILCQMAAETLKAEKGSYEAVGRNLTGTSIGKKSSDKEFYIYYREDWQPAEGVGEAEYILCVTEEVRENVIKGTVQVWSVKGGELLYSLPVSRQEVAYE